MNLTRTMAEITAGAALITAVALINTTRAASDELAAAAGTLRSVAAAAKQPSMRTLGCSDDSPGALVTQEAAVALDRRVLGRGVVLSWRCVDAAGRRHPSMVEVVRPGQGGDLPTTAGILIQPSQDLHVHQITARSGGVRILASYWQTTPRGCCSASPDQGSVSVLTFARASGAHRQTDWVFESSQPTVHACAAVDLTVSIVRRVAAVGAAANLGFVNIGPSVCAIEGYPGVLAQTRAGYPRAAAPVLSGLSGGVRRDTVAPIVLLQPRESATAVLESLPRGYGGCDTSRWVEVSLPAGGQVARLPFVMQLCEAQVHPVTPGTSGWSD